MQLDNIFEVIKQVGQQPFKSFVEISTRNSITQGSNSYAYMSTNGFVFNQFESLEKAFSKKNKIKQKANKTHYETSALSNVTNKEYDNYKSFTDYLEKPRPEFTKIKDISKVLVENIKTLINLGGLFANDRIIVTEDTRGVFDFGLASLGLYRPIEFYSKSLYEDMTSGEVKNNNDFLGLQMGVVNSDMVNKKVFGDNTTYLFTYLGKTYECERRQKGATKVFNTFPSECFLKSNTDGIIITYYLNDKNKVYNGSGDAKLKYSSNNKKSYFIYNKKDDSVKNVDIFMPVNYVLTDTQKAIALLPAYLISASLEEFGIQTRINAVRLGSDSNTQITISIPVKNYDETPKESFNRIYALLALGDSASDFFGFHKIITENEGEQAPQTRSSSTAFTHFPYTKQLYMDEMMQRYKNWSEKNKDKSFYNSKVNNPNFQFAIASEDVIGSGKLDYDIILKNLHKIFFQFYYYIDFLAIEMISMRDFIKSVHKRFTEDETFRKLYLLPSDKKDIKDLIRSYVITILVQKYRIVSGGSYDDSNEQIKKKEDTFKQKVISLNEELNSI